MRLNRETIGNFRPLMAVALVAAAEALCQDRQTGLRPPLNGAGPERRIVVSIPDRKLVLIEAGRVVRIYAAAVGAPSSPSPTGTFTIVQRIANPAWYGPGKVVGPGKDNPLGPRWIGLSRKSYGIHGTNNPRSIGHCASHGCIRMRNSDVKDLFERVAVGDVVELRAAPVEEIAGIGGTSHNVSTTLMAGGGQ
jgi:lipoprotein-anchoring transpeptidase ErfK/SrfK